MACAGVYVTAAVGADREDAGTWLVQELLMSCLGRLRMLASAGASAITYGTVPDNACLGNRLMQEFMLPVAPSTMEQAWEQGLCPTSDFT